MRINNTCTQSTGGGNFFVPNFNKLPCSFRSQGDTIFFWTELKCQNERLNKPGDKVDDDSTFFLSGDRGGVKGDKRGGDEEQELKSNFNFSRSPDAEQTLKYEKTD